MSDRNRALTKKQLSNLKEKLHDERTSMVKLWDDGFDLARPEGSDEVEQSISDYTNSHLLRFKNRESFYLKKIEKALKKFDLHEYGKCSDCGDWIKFERLLARPTAELCILCKEESERSLSLSVGSSTWPG
jgi:DnaK suppressor protein